MCVYKIRVLRFKCFQVVFLLVMCVFDVFYPAETLFLYWAVGSVFTALSAESSAFDFNNGRKQAHCEIV